MQLDVAGEHYYLRNIGKLLDPNGLTACPAFSEAEGQGQAILHDSHMGRPFLRKSLVALAVVVVLLALIVADWWQQRREFSQLVDRTSHARAYAEGESLESGRQDSPKVAARDLKQIHANYAQVADVFILPWHRDMRAFRSASLALGAAEATEAELYVHPDPDSEAWTEKVVGSDVKVTSHYSPLSDRSYKATPAFTDPYFPFQ